MLDKVFNLICFQVASGFDKPVSEIVVYIFPDESIEPKLSAGYSADVISVELWQHETVTDINTKLVATSPSTRASFNLLNNPES